MNSRKAIPLTDRPAMESGREEVRPPSLPPSPETPLITAAEVRAIVDEDRAEWESEYAEPARRIGFQAAPFSTVENAAPAPVPAPEKIPVLPPVSDVAENVAPATKKRGPGHIPDHISAPEKIPVSQVEKRPVSASEIPPVPGVNWNEIRVPDRGQEKTFRSGPILWKFRSDRECWRVMFEREKSDPAPVTLGNLGKRELSKLDRLPDADRRAAILARLREWIEGRGINA